MTSDERIEALHSRMDSLRRARERRKTAAIGAASGAVALCLILFVFIGSRTQLSGAAGLYSGSTILFEGAGAFVLVALIAFMVGVIVTVALKKRKKDGD